MNANKYPGVCDCGVRVEAGEGFYNGNVFCEEVSNGMVEWDGETVFVDIFSCSRYRLREGKAKIIGKRFRDECAKGRADETYMSANPKAQTAITAYWAEQNDPEVVARRTAHEAKQAELETKWANAGQERCNRCGGAGGRKEWPGFNCFKCEGRGAVEVAS